MNGRVANADLITTRGILHANRPILYDQGMRACHYSLTLGFKINAGDLTTVQRDQCFIAPG